MATASNPAGTPQVDETQGLMSYRGWQFSFGAQRTPTGLYRPVVQRLSGPLGTSDGAGPALLPDDTEEIAYATEAEALRHAQQQAMRWVHDRTGDGQGQF